MVGWAPTTYHKALVSFGRLPRGWHEHGPFRVAVNRLAVSGLGLDRKEACSPAACMELDRHGSIACMDMPRSRRTIDRVSEFRYHLYYPYIILQRKRF